MKRFSILIVLFAILGSSNAQEVDISFRLQEKLKENSDDYLHISILLKDRIDVLSLERELERQNLTLQEKAEIVIRSLQDKAGKTQVDLLEFLHSRNDIQSGSINDYWLSNMVYCKVRKTLIKDLSNRQDIERIDLNGKLELVDDFRSAACSSAAPDNVEPGLLAINADKLWKMGYTGRGRFALGADTGIEPSHPAINGQYRGLYFDDSQTWYHWENYSTEPYDCDDHGTHTIGTVLGLDRITNDTIGVAPNATYIGANIIVCSATSGSQDNLASFQWAVDPDGNPATIDDIPDAINNSWNDREAGPCNPEYTDAFQAMEAVGIAVIFAAGNDGSEPETLTFPKNVNYDEVNCFAVGALDAGTESLRIAGFSSRGPSLCGGTGSLAIKPEVSAPGVNVRSAILGGGYAEFNGTSMAAPHVVGAILLLKEAFPFLTGRDLKFALYNTCRDLGEPGEDNTYGQGIIDVKAAFDYLIAQGHQAVDPSLSRDIVLYGLNNDSGDCNSTFSPELLIENLGTDTAFNIEIGLSIPDLNWDTTMIWNGTLAPGGRTSIQLSSRSILPGFYSYSAEIMMINGLEDLYKFNNKLESSIEVFPAIELNASIEMQDQSVFCENSMVSLVAIPENYTLSGTQEIQWFDQLTGGNRLGTGNNFVTPALSTTRSFYSQLIDKASIGPENNGIGNTLFIEDEVAGGIRFDSRALTLKSVKIYLQKTGLVTIVLLDQSGNTLELKQQVITQPGEHVVELDFEVPTARNMSLEIRGLTMPLINSEGANFPYQLPGGLVLKENTISGSEGAYYCFYDWQVELPVLCKRTEVEVPVTDLNASFSVSNTEINVFDAMVEFNNLSLGADRYFWDFGDGFTSTEVDPIHTYEMAGEYEVQLIGWDLFDCSDTTQRIVEVQDTLSNIDDLSVNTFSVFPNPVSNQMIIQGNIDFHGTAHLINQLGKVVLEQKITPDSRIIHTEDLPNGVYFLNYNNHIVKVVKTE